MTRRLAAMCFMAMLLIGVSSLSVRAQNHDVATLKGINAVLVVVEDLSDGAKVIGLTAEAIQTDVELKLRLAGMRAVTHEEFSQLLGMPMVYVRVTLTSGADAVSTEIRLPQNARLQRNDQLALGVATWSTIYVTANPTAHGIRDTIKDGVDDFLNAWLSVNPKK